MLAFPPAQTVNYARHSVEGLNRCPHLLLRLFCQSPGNELLEYPG